MKCKCANYNELLGVKADDFIRKYLDEVYFDNDRWEILYLCKHCGLYWFSKPEASERHGGGETILTKIDKKDIKERFVIASSNNSLTNFIDSPFLF